jgi:hypothetical protein
MMVAARLNVINGFISQDMTDANNNFITIWPYLEEVETARNGETDLNTRINTAETSAASSATAAAASETAAASSASAASTSETAAAASETAAAASETAAAASETAAATSETNAGGSASAASSYASQAAASETAAAASETAAANAATAAANAATSAANAATSAAASATTAANYANALTATSTSSLSIITGTRSFTTQADKDFDTGQKVIISSDADPTNYMYGYVVSYSSTTLNTYIEQISGSGSYNDWNISISGIPGSVDDEWSLTPAPTTDGTASGIIVPMVCGTDVITGCVYRIGSSGKMLLADADQASTMPAIAFALENGSADDTKNFLFYGFYRNDAYSWTPGSLLYTNIFGVPVTTAPSGSGDQVQIIGVTTHADRIFFNPQYTTLGIA